jgi:hypothetical protein
MCHRRAGLHLKCLGIEGAQARGAGEALDCIVMFAEDGLPGSLAEIGPPRDVAQEDTFF